MRDWLRLFKDHRQRRRNGTGGRSEVTLPGPRSLVRGTCAVKIRFVRVLAVRRPQLGGLLRGVGLVALGLFGALAVEASDLSSAHAHTCSVTPEGGVSCWGLNDHGQLGDGSLFDSLLPTAVTGLGGAAVAVASGSSHSCALLASGAVACWGDNTDGQLGTGDLTLARSLTPVPVVGLGGSVATIAAGVAHTCVTLSFGAVQCWGDNADGQLGDSSFTDRFAPIAVPGLSVPITELALGEGHTCALTMLNAVLCWGDNSAGQLGDGTTANKPFVNAVPSLSMDVATLGAGVFHSCAVKTTGEALCWGDNFLGQLGTGDFDDRHVPTLVVGLGGAVDRIDAGEGFTCARLVSGGLECWGDNLDGQLGDGTTDERVDPMPVLGLSGAVDVLALGDSHGCARMVGGAMECWGDNFYGQLGDGSTTTALAPVAVVTATPVPLLPASRFGLGILLACLGGFYSTRRRG